MTIITSKSNNLIKKTKKLLQKKHRQTSYLIEGWHLLEEAKQSGATIRRVFALPEMEARVKEFSEVILVSLEVLKELCETSTPQGVVAEVEMPDTLPPSHLKGRFVVLEDVQDPGNVGTIIRTADAAGFSGVFLSQYSADIYNDKTLRAMQGSHFHLPIYRMDMAMILDRLKQANCLTVATTLSRHSIDYKSLPKSDSVAIVFGNEGRGVSEKTCEQVDVLTHITMPGQAESLNVAVAAGIVIFSYL